MEFCFIENIIQCAVHNWPIMGGWGHESRLQNQNLSNIVQKVDRGGGIKKYTNWLTSIVNGPVVRGLPPTVTPGILPQNSPDLEISLHLWTSIFSNFWRFMSISGPLSEIPFRPSRAFNPYNWTTHYTWLWHAKLIIIHNFELRIILPFISDIRSSLFTYYKICVNSV